MARGRLTDERLAELARKHKKYQQREKKAKEVKDRLSKKICGELKTRRRKTEDMEETGVKITRVVQERTDYDWHGIRNDLVTKYGAKKGNRLANLIRPQAVDASALSRLMQAGEIDADIVAEHSRTYTHAEYPIVSFPEASDED